MLASPLLVDAKFKRVITDTRSEETYKMLGYAENFRDAFGQGFHSIVIFFGESFIETILEGPGNARLSLIVVEQYIQSRVDFERSLDRAVQYWLDSVLGTT